VSAKINKVRLGECRLFGPKTSKAGFYPLDGYMLKQNLNNAAKVSVQLIEVQKIKQRMSVIRLFLKIPL